MATVSLHRCCSSANTVVVNVKCTAFLVLIVFAMFAICTAGRNDKKSKNGVVVVESEQPTEPESKPFCTFFNNRATNYQPNLKNCTWFKGNCCCRQVEITATFGAMKPLIGASENCQRYTNYLMCYICDPSQSTFYIWQKLTVCKEFCDKFLDACKDATLKGSRIGDMYKDDGTEFCRSRRYEVKDRNSSECFYFDETMDPDKSGSGTLHHGVNGVTWNMVWILISVYVGKSILSIDYQVNT